MVKKITDKTEDNYQKRRKRFLFFFIFFSAVFLIVATYAWLSTTLNVKVKFFKMQVQSNSGLSISLDGINFDESVYVSVDTVINDLTRLYPNHTNQWAIGGLWPVSSNGINNSNSRYFDFYMGVLARTRSYNPNGSIKRLLHAIYVSELKPRSDNQYLGFDVFFKNVTGSPKPDNLYFDNGTKIIYDSETPEEIKPEMDGIMNSLRIGLVYMGSVSLNASTWDIQNISCNNKCRAFIFEPYSTNHSPASIETAQNYGVTLKDGVYTPTYAVIHAGEYLEHTNGHVGTGLALDSGHFAQQRTMTEADFADSLFLLPNGITKTRIYVWLEGQDIDSLETYSKGTALEIAINFVKDMIGYE